MHQDEQKGAHSQSDAQQEQERLRAENEVLRQQNQQLWSANQNNKSNKTLPIIACAVVAVLCIFVMIHILAAVALPMYSTFKQKARASIGVKAIVTAETALKTWHQDNASFLGAAVDQTGGAITMNGHSIGAGLPKIENATWSISGSQDQLVIMLGWTAGCPSSICDTVYTISAQDGVYYTKLVVGSEDDNLGLNRQSP